VGAWGEGPFENDTAVDWARNFFEADLDLGMQLVEQALREVAYAAEDADVGAGAGIEAVAAAELVAAMLELPVQRPDGSDAFDWIDRTQPAPDVMLAMLAVEALDRVVAGRSELAELWDETGTTSWRQSIEERRVSLVLYDQQ
jgi:Domain of unknown function (DUF4259)